MASKRPRSVLDILRALWSKDCGWVSAVNRDLHWFCCSGFFPGPACPSLPSAFDIIAGDPKGFCRAVRRFASSKFANFDVPLSLPIVAPPLFVNSICSDCGKCFNSYQKLALHRKVKHGARNPVDLLVDSVFCPICLLYFHDRIRLLNHLKYRSTICKLNLLAVGPLISAKRADELDLDSRVLRRSRFAAGLRAHAAVDPVFSVTRASSSSVNSYSLHYS